MTKQTAQPSQSGPSPAPAPNCPSASVSAGSWTCNNWYDDEKVCGVYSTAWSPASACDGCGEYATVSIGANKDNIVTLPKGKWQIRAYAYGIAFDETWGCGSECAFANDFSVRFKRVYMGIRHYVGGAATILNSAEVSGDWISLETDGCPVSRMGPQGAGDIGFDWTDFNCPYDSGCPIDYIWWWDLRGFAHNGIWESDEYIYGKLHLGQAKVEWRGEGCDSTSCRTSNDWNCGFNAGETKSNMCGNYQYYWYTSSGPEVITWTMTADQNAGTDACLYTRWDVGMPPSTSNYDCGQCDAPLYPSVSCTKCLTNSGTRHALVNKYSGTGKYDISLSASDVECCSATDCKGTDGTYDTYCPKDSTVPNYVLPTCDSANTCQCEPTCGSTTGVNARCAQGYCCTGEKPQGPGESLFSSTCKLKSTVVNPWLCT